MRGKVPEVSWHNKEPVLSMDLYPSEGIYRLATGGGDGHVLVWKISFEGPDQWPHQDCLCDLTRHQKAVNIVRWSPCGLYLASGDDDANIIIWCLKKEVSLLGEVQESWVLYKVLRGHQEDVMDLCWSPFDLKLITGSIDNTAIIWNVLTGQSEQTLAYHHGFVQGVSWSPKNDIVASISTDRTLRFFSVVGGQLLHKINKGKAPVSESHILYNKEVKYFHDDTYKSFYRRMEFSPDGSVILVPSARLESTDLKEVLYATVAFIAPNMTSPSFILPHDKCSTCVRFCPIIFELREDGPVPYVDAPYRMIFCVGMGPDIAFYDTQQPEPFAKITGYHYTRLTDLTWSRDGLLCCGSSTDGYCSIILFEEGELGVPYKNEQVLTNQEPNMEHDMRRNNVESNFLEQWAQTAQKETTTNKSVTDKMSSKWDSSEIRPIAVRRGPRITSMVQQIISKENKKTPKENVEISSDERTTSNRNLPSSDENIIVNSDKRTTSDENLPSSDENIIVISDERTTSDENLPSDENIIVISDERTTSDENLPSSNENIIVNSNKRTTSDENFPSDENIVVISDERTTSDENLPSSNESIIVNSDKRTSSDENLPSSDGSIALNKDIPRVVEKGNRIVLLYKNAKKATTVSEGSSSENLSTSDENLTPNDKNLSPQDETVTATRNIDDELQGTKVDRIPKKASTGPLLKNTKTARKVTTHSDPIVISSDENLSSRNENNKIETNVESGSIETAGKFTTPNENVVIISLDEDDRTSDQDMKSGGQTVPLNDENDYSQRSMPVVANAAVADKIRGKGTKRVNTLSTFIKTEPGLKKGKRKRTEDTSMTKIDPSSHSKKKQCIAVVDLTLSDNTDDEKDLEDASDKNPDHGQNTDRPAPVSQPRAHRVPLVTLASPKSKVDKGKHRS